MRRVAFAMLLLAPLVALVGPARAQKIQERREAPPPIPPEPGCTRWEGSVSGNDTVLARIRLCQTGTHVHGRFQWSSPRSGWNERELDGEALDGGSQLVLHDVKFVANQPNPRWRFCLVDRYVLDAPSDDRLTGSYTSSACHDRATIDLHRVADEPDPPARPEAPSAPALPEAPPAPPSPSAPPPPTPARAGGCHCEIACPARTDGAALSAVVCALAAAGRRARRRRLRRA